MRKLCSLVRKFILFCVCGTSFNSGHMMLVQSLERKKKQKTKNVAFV